MQAALANLCGPGQVQQAVGFFEACLTIIAGHLSADLLPPPARVSAMM
jgi:hypothetical protein